MQWIPGSTDKDDVGVSPVWIIPITGLLATLFWESPLLLPAKLLTVLLHEMGHAMAALAFGGQVERIVISPQESGETIISNITGLVPFSVAASMGYFGSALIGGFCLHRGLRARLERLTLIVLSGLLFYFSMLFTRGADTAFLTGTGWAIALALLAIPGRAVARAALLVVGTLLLWYCFFDLFDFIRPGSSTDADLLAQYLVREGHIARGAVSTAATGIASAWVLILACGLLVTLHRVSVASDRTAAPAPAESTPEIPEQEAFPGELTPEVELWLMQRGLGADGQPLLPVGMELPAIPPATQPVAEAPCPAKKQYS